MKHGKMILGELHADIPVIQGGMGVGISLSGLAGAVAAAGGIGIISTAQIGFREPDFDRDPIACNLRTIGKEIEKARQTARGGIVGVNIMVATQRYECPGAATGRCWLRSCRAPAPCRSSRNTG